MYKHLTWADRLRIEKGLREGLNPYRISKLLRVNHATIYKELKRGSYTPLNADWTTEERYSPDIAQQRYRESLSAKGPQLKIGKDRELARFFEHKISVEGYSPAAVVAEMRRLGTFQTTISEKTIYNYIDKGILLISREDLPGSRRKRTYKRIKRAAKPPRGTSIEQRSDEINSRITFGHWGGDCVCGKKRTRATLFVLTERLTRKEIIVKMPNQTAASVVAALNTIERRFGKRFPEIFQSITFDNGSEFSDTSGIERSVYGNRQRTKAYYCYPYCSFERGSNENANRLIRRFLPKGTAFENVSKTYIKNVERWINSYPREVLNWRCADDVFREYL